MNKDGESYYKIESIIAHPQYDPSKSFYMDFSLLKLSTSVSISATAGVICLPSDGTSTFAGTSLRVSGWGTTSPGTLD